VAIEGETGVAPRFDFKTIDWRSSGVTKEKIAVGAGLIVLVGAGFAAGTLVGHKAPAGAQTMSAAPAGVASQAGGGAAGGLTPTAGAGPTALTLLQAGNCKTYAPQGWRITDQNASGTVFTTTSADGQLIGSYGGVIVNAAQAAGVYGPQFRSPDAFVLYAVSLLTNEQAQPAGAEQQVGGYTALPFSTSTHSGYALVYRFPGPGGGYGVIMRIAIGSGVDAKSVGVAGAVAAATRCQAMVHPTASATYQPPTEEHGTGSTGDGDDMAGTYNAQLGTGWVHDSAGNNYNVDVAADYHETGPDGPGYYKINGNDIIKLEPGLE
jgi:hypothetical protein